MPTPTNLSARLLERIAEQFRALGEPSRLQLMQLLFAGERTVGELVAASGLSLANVSKHLGILHQVGWVTRRKAGLNVVYGLADERALGLCDLMCDRVRERAEAEVTATAPPARRRARG
ncbi:MAG: winged helix-turn-helix transcriptional regulator [Planctomycetes bacterium]|nr:winged helix-turn-helix transcriptional regulator [Planctomycetota bacterium]